jgi:hypothetical protein
MSFSTSVIILILVISTAAIIGFIKNEKQSNKYKAKKLMTDNEFEFFKRLVQALPEYYVFPQVAMNAVLQANGNDRKENYGIRNTFSQKVIDYVIYNQQGKIVAIIELDDKTHNKEKDEKRDAMLHQAGYKTVRFQSKNKPNTEDIRKQVI